MDKEKEQQRFLELSALFNKNNAIKHIIFLEQKLAKYESIPIEPPVMQQKCDIEQKYKDFRDYILEKEKEGKIVVNTAFGLGEISLDEIVKQHTEGLLYDLNRDRCTILTFIEDEKWVNDFACMKVIEKLKALLSA